ncbi:hypothetical protein KCU73_g74, partial [Aureobasidium melanogenum]
LKVYQSGIVCDKVTEVIPIMRSFKISNCGQGVPANFIFQHLPIDTATSHDPTHLASSFPPPLSKNDDYACGDPCHIGTEAVAIDTWQNVYEQMPRAFRLIFQESNFRTTAMASVGSVVPSPSTTFTSTESVVSESITSDRSSSMLLPKRESVLALTLMRFTLQPLLVAARRRRSRVDSMSA